MRRVRVIISGTVQEVNFRWVTKTQAQTRVLTGWVKNTIDGKVETEIQGDEESIVSMIEFLKRGPRSAEVTDVQIEDIEIIKESDSFEVIY